MRPSKKLISTVLAATCAAVLSAPGSALAEYYIPPGNSAVNQYTESFPGAGGEIGGAGKKVTPAQALGSENAKRLENQGDVGREAAEVAAATAPPEELYERATEQQPARDEDGGSDSSAAAGTGGAPGGGDSGGGGAAAGTGSAAATVDAPAGSSAVGSVLGEASGLGGGNIGLWLPLAIVAILAWAGVYWSRTRTDGRAA